MQYTSSLRNEVIINTFNVMIKYWKYSMPEICHRVWTSVYLCKMEMYIQQSYTYLSDGTDFFLLVSYCFYLADIDQRGVSISLFAFIFLSWYPEQLVWVSQAVKMCRGSPIPDVFTRAQNVCNDSQMGISNVCMWSARVWRCWSAELGVWDSWSVKP